MADIVFILGAGCSVHAGAPVMRDFLDRSTDLLRAGKVNDKKAEFELVQRAIGALQAVHSKCQLDIVNVESVFSAVDTARVLKAFPSFKEEEIEELFEALQWVIVRTLEASMEFPTRGGGVLPSTEYNSFAELIGQIREGEPHRSVAVLTFNYDVGLDIAFAFNSLTFDYGLMEGGAGVPLLKLHGSINWTRDTKNSAITAVDMRDYLNRYRIQFPTNDVHRVYVPISTQLIEFFRNRKIPVDGRPVIVPPTLSKAEYQKVVAPVWKRAAAELGNAERIYVLGYSLPETDQFFRLLYGLGSASAVPLRDFSVFNPDGNVNARFRTILGPTALDRFGFREVDFGQACGILKGMFPGRAR